MPKIAYIDKRFSPASLATVLAAVEIIEEYEGQGFKLTLRQLYYQFVARDLCSNKQSEYKRLGEIIKDARRAGYIDWLSIEDRTRNLKEIPSWGGPDSMIDYLTKFFRRDRWATQEYRLEVWIEKEALAGVFDRACKAVEIPFFCCRGYPSESEVWRASRRFLRYQENEQTPVILHFGDHDPSGIDMTRDIQDRMQLFGIDLLVDRLALNMDQVEEFDPPPNPTKLTDSRSPIYLQIYGSSSWELDALEPAFLADLVERTALTYRDDEAWEEALEEDQESVEELLWTSRHWDEVMDLRGDEDA